MTGQLSAVSLQLSAKRPSHREARKQKFRQLAVWQKAMDLIGDVYRVTTRFPTEELYGLTSQLRRAAVSIAMNIAEGSGADSDQEFKRFLVMASRSGYEVMCGIEVAMKLEYLSGKQGIEALDKLEELSAMIHGFVKTLKAAG